MKEFNLTEVNEKISKESAFVDDLRKAFSRIIIGQKELINKIIIAPTMVKSVIRPLNAVKMLVETPIAITDGS